MEGKQNRSIGARGGDTRPKVWGCRVLLFLLCSLPEAVILLRISVGDLTVQFSPKKESTVGLTL